jgi:hypothetical protein
LSLLFGGAAPTAGLTATNATIIAILLIVAVAGKSALLPFSRLAASSDGGPHPFERRVLRVPLDSRRLLSAAARGAAARTGACGPAPCRGPRCGHGAVRGNHDARPERREVVAGLCLAHAGGIIVTKLPGWYTSRLSTWWHAAFACCSS